MKSPPRRLPPLKRRQQAIKAINASKSAHTNRPADIGEVQPHEREAAAFWFRRITTTLLVGNGGGVVAVASYLANTQDSTATAAVAYPALSYFLSGVIITVCSYMVSMLWSGLRVEAYVVHYGKIAERLNTRRNTRSDSKETLREWLAKKPRPAIKGEGWVAFGLFFLGSIQLLAISASGLMFYSGASTVLTGTREALCTSQSSHHLCQYAPSLIFPGPDALINSITDDHTSRYLTISQYPVTATAEFEKLDTRSLWPTRVLVRRDGVEQYTRGFVEIVVRLTDHGTPRSECFLELVPYSQNITSPYIVSPQLREFFEHASSVRDGISLEPISLSMTMIFRGTDGETHSWMQSYDIQNGELSGPRQPYDTAARLHPSNSARGGAYVFTPREYTSDIECLAMAVRFGFEHMEIPRSTARTAE